MPDKTDSRPPTKRTHLIVSWPTAAIGAAVVAIAALAALAIVVNESQILATLAIVLAVVAFVVQLIVFIAQAQTAANQSVHAEELHGELQEVLAKIQERTEGTQESLVGMNEKLLEAALGRSLPAAQKAASGDKNMFVRDLAAATFQNLREQGEPSGSSVPQTAEPSRDGHRASDFTDWPTRRPTDEDKHAWAVSSTWPTRAEADGALSAIEELSDADLARLPRFVEDDLSQLEDSDDDEMLIPGFGRSERDSPFISAGILEPTGYISPSTHREIVGLTPKGRLIARLMTALDPIPSELRGDSRVIRLRGVRHRRH